MFSRILLFTLVLCLLFVNVVLAALDSATVVNGVGTAGQIGQAIANANGNAAAATIIASVTGLITTILAAIFGHRHGKRSIK